MLKSILQPYADCMASQEHACLPRQMPSTPPNGEEEEATFQPGTVYCLKQNLFFGTVEKKRQ